MSVCGELRRACAGSTEESCGGPTWGKVEPSGVVGKAIHRQTAHIILVWVWVWVWVAGQAFRTDFVSRLDLLISVRKVEVVAA